MCQETQPAKGVLARRRITNRAVASALGISETYVCRVLNGLAPASSRFRRGVAELLELPESVLFHDDQAKARRAS